MGGYDLLKRGAILEDSNAYIRWNSELGRYELHIRGVLKAYTHEDFNHEMSKLDMADMARVKGWNVVYDVPRA